MNDKDKEAFRKCRDMSEFYASCVADQKTVLVPEDVCEGFVSGWQAACEYKQSELAYHIYKIELEKSLLGQEIERLQNYVIAGYKEGIDELEAKTAELKEKK